MDSLESVQQHLAAIVEGSDDAIVTKNLDSIILSWNRSAERLFGYTADEAIGKPITIIFPEDRLEEEVGFIARLRRGERIAHYETIRRRKDGSLVPVSLTVSPVRDPAGRIIGASKIARDISLQHRVAEQQRLLLSEMRHRVGNAFALAGGLLSITARHAESIDDLVFKMRRRLSALASVHSMAVVTAGADASEATRLKNLVVAIVEPFTDMEWVQLDVPDVPVCAAAITPLSLVIFELATNAVKYGGLSAGGQGVSVSAEIGQDRLYIRWEEKQVQTPADIDIRRQGFGTRMINSTVHTSFAGTFSRDFVAGSMIALLALDLTSVTGTPEPASSGREEMQG